MTSIYAGIEDVRNLTGLSSNTLSDNVISGMIQYATAQINGDIQILWKDERVIPISDEKENDIDGSNTVFYTQHYPIGDYDNNGLVSGVDVYAYKLDSDGTRSRIIVTTINDAGIGKVTLASAPSSSDRLYFTYYSAPVNVCSTPLFDNAPHSLVKLATSQLAAALCFTRIDASKVQSFRVGKVAVMRQSDAFNIYMRMYTNTLNRIKQESFKVLRGAKTL